jgi:membrane-associated phospholipid phosphatase
MSTQPIADPPAYRIYDPRLLPARTPASRSRRLVRCLLWIAVVTLFAFALSFDIELMRLRYNVLPEGSRGFAKEAVSSFRDFGQTVPIIVGCIIILALDRRRWTIVPVILVAQFIGMPAYDAVKLTVVRDRPQTAIQHALQAPPLGMNSPDNAQHALAVMHVGQTWHGLSRYNSGSSTQSFPSGHSAASFAFAGVLSWFYPPLAILWWLLAVGCAVSRYVDAVHWVSDCVAGASIGYAAAWLALRPHLWSVPLKLIRRPCATGSSIPS